MVTQQKLKIYFDFHGNIDEWVRIGSNKEHKMMNDDDWFLIDGLLQDIFIVHNGLASRDFADTLNSKILVACDNTETLNELKKAAISGKR